MGSVLVFEGPRQLGYQVEESRAPAPREVAVRTLYSGISAGTELTAYRGTNPYLHKRWDPERRLFVSGGDAGAEYPLVGWGYEEVGEIVEVGSELEGDLRPGQRIYGIWGHRERTLLPGDVARDRLLPGEVPPIRGVFARIGEIALNGILDAHINLGETVAVFGMGVVGQVASQLARLSGARVIAVDLSQARLEMAERLGADEIIDANGTPVAERIKELTGRGADVCIEATGSTQALNEAIRACAYSSRVVALGFYQGEPRGLHLGEEFHHNRIDLVCSQISGVDPALRHRWDAARLRGVFIELVASERIVVEPLVTHVAPFDQAARLFELLDGRTDEVMQAVLEFPEAP